MTDLPHISRPQPPGRLLAWLLAIVVHLVLLIFLIWGVRWQNEKPHAVAVELISAPPSVAPPKAEPAPPPPKAEPLPPPPPPAPVRPDIALKEPPKPKPEVKPTTEPKPEPAPKPAPKPEPALKPEPAPKPEPKPKAEAKPKAEPEAPVFDPLRSLAEEEKRLAERKEREAAQRALDEELARLDAARAQQAAASLEKARAEYIARLRGKIRGNIVMSQDVRGNPEAVFEVTQLPSGEIIDVRLRRSSGNPAWDAATERAIHKSSPLPKPERAELFSRVLELRFRPQEN